MTPINLMVLPDQPGEFIRAVRNDPAHIFPLLANRDTRLRYLFKKRKKKSIESASEDAYKKLLFNPEYQINRLAWLSLKASLLCSTPELIAKTGCKYTENLTSLYEPELPEAAFVLWLLQQAGISPHHCRQMLTHDQKAIRKTGIPLSKRMPCDVLFYMHGRLLQHKGGAREIFQLSRLWWIYCKNDEAKKLMILLMLNLTRSSAQT